jgi:serine/threonine protein kinase/tetratricopeptide (TPR) repeat protein
MPLTAGDRLGPYQILAPIGSGGMGEVYRAHDTRLGRNVAVKISAEQFTERFEREARVIANLNHPNICHLYDVGPNYLVMEYVEGAPLKGPLPLDRIFPVAIEIADALDAAQSKGVVHRDLKPANIMISRDGHVKILDFGLAQMDAQSAGDATRTLAITDPGTTVGTVAYMSPEQARGQPLDSRTDLWSFGVVLYEMVAGVRPFEGATVALLFEAILNKTFMPVRERNSKIPLDLDRIISRLLEKDRDMRYQSAADVRSELKRVERDSSGGVSTAPSASRPTRKWKYGTAAALLLLIIGAGLLWRQRKFAPPLTDKDVLVLADFANTTGDPVFDGALREALSIQLEQSPFLQTLSGEQMRQDLRLMGRSPDDRITNDVAREICLREGQKAMLGGSIASLGRSFAIALQATGCQSGDRLASAGAEAQDKEHVIEAVGKAARAMRGKLGESLGSIKDPDAPLARVTTNSLEALRQYELGEAQSDQGLWLKAIPFYQRATELDPNFAIAWESLGGMQGNAGNPAGRAAAMTKAFAVRERASEKERRRVEGMYYYYVAHDLSKAIAAFQLWVRTYPRESLAHTALGNVLSQSGEFEAAVREYKEGIRVQPRYAIAYSNLVRLYIRNERFEEAKAMAQQAFAQKVDAPNIHQFLLLVADIQEDQPATAREVQWFQGKPEEYLSLRDQAEKAVVHGQRTAAKNLYQRTADVARRQGLPDAQSGDPALIDAQMGDCRAASRAKGDSEMEARVLCGDPSAIRLAEARLAKTPPPNSEPAELVYSRGLADLRAHDAAKARSEFQSIVDHKGRNWGPYYSLAYLGLARASAMGGDTAKAKSAYQGFLALWKDADKDAPFLRQATMELSQLH